MALVDDAKAQPDTTLIELNRFAEVDLSLIIKAYEEAMLESETEEGVIASNYGELEKQKGAMSMFLGITDNYGKSGNDFTGQPSDQLVLEGLGQNPFGDCFPCDGRITIGLDNLPHPAIFNPFSGLFDAIEAFIQRMKNVMDSTNFYSDICRLLDAFRIICPQDLLILLALLRFLLRHYITLSFQLNLDWLSILGLILLPILLLIQTLLQLAVNIGLGPLNCLIDLIVTFKAIASSASNTFLTAKDAVTTTVQSFDDVGAEFSGLVSGDSDSGGGSVDIGASFSAGVAPPSIPDRPDGGYQKYADFIGKLSGLDSMLIGMTDVKLTLEAFLGKFTRALETLIAMLSGGLLLKMQFTAAIVDILRLIGFLMALIKGLQDKSICDDPSVPLSAKDIQTLIGTLNASSTASTSGGSDSKSLISSTIGLDFDTATGELIIQDKIENQSKRVPTCLSTMSGDDRVMIEQWISELEASSI